MRLFLYFSLIVEISWYNEVSMNLSYNTKILNVALVGKPNSGKSSLINYIMGDLICIVSEKPHSTREAVLAVLNKQDTQIVLIDTPGVNDSKKKEFKELTSKAIGCLKQADCALFLIDSTKSVPQYILDLAEENSSKINIAVITKIDSVNKGRLLPMTHKLSRIFNHIFSISMAKEDEKKIDHLLEFLKNQAKPGEWQFPKEFITQKSDISKMEDRVKEALFSLLHKEIPYQLEIGITEEVKNKHHYVYIIVKGSAKYKPIVLGKISELGPKIRENLKKQLGKNVHSFLEYKVDKSK